jgi:predicted transcriptional regulator
MTDKVREVKKLAKQMSAKEICAALMEFIFLLREADHRETLSRLFKEKK